MCAFRQWFFKGDNSSISTNVVVFLGPVVESECISSDSVGNRIPVRVCGSDCQDFLSQTESFWDSLGVSRELEERRVEVAGHSDCDICCVLYIWIGGVITLNTELKNERYKLSLQ